MLKKFISIKNVGRFQNSATSGNPSLSKTTVLLASNGYGKTTICAILRSLQSGDSTHIEGRKRLGVAIAPSVELLFDHATVRFSRNTWNTTYPDIAIFDGHFVSENIYSGEIVELENRRNLHRVIIGSVGLNLANRDSELATSGRAKTMEITEVRGRISPHVPDGVSFDSFMANAPVTDVDDKIAELEGSLRAITASSNLLAQPALPKLMLPPLPMDFTSLLARSIEDISSDAESQINLHIRSHLLGDGGRAWLAKGTSFPIDEFCPFCGQSTAGVSLLGAYKTAFGASYRELKSDIDNMRVSLTNAFGSSALAQIETLLEQLQNRVAFWTNYCALDSLKLTYPPEIGPYTRSLLDASLALLDEKAASPLETVEIDANFNSKIRAYEELLVEAANIDRDIEEANALIEAKKGETEHASVSEIGAELSRLRAAKARHGDAADLCQAHTRLLEEKVAIDREKSEVRDQLREHMNTVVGPYENRINEFLDRFNAGFSIAETSHSFSGGQASSSYQIVINNTPVPLGDARTLASAPSFRNTLSSGDRTTLALAFFLAHAERDPRISNKTIVLDDPFNSQDSFRRRQTIHEIIKLSQYCAQIIVLSHDPTFLKQLLDKCEPSQRTALSIQDHRSYGSKITAIDLDQFCQNRTVRDLDAIQTYVSAGQGDELDVIRKLRVVLETHARTLFPTEFGPTDWLGDIIRKIREGGPSHVAGYLYAELNEINDYTSQYHHGEDTANLTPDAIDPIELTGFARRTLRIVNTSLG